MSRMLPRSPSTATRSSSPGRLSGTKSGWPSCMRKAFAAAAHGRRSQTVASVMAVEPRMAMATPWPPRSPIVTGPSATLDSVSVDPSGTWRDLQRPLDARKVEAFEISEGNEADAALGGKIDEHAPRQQRIGFLGTAGDEAGAAAPRDLQRLAEKPGRVIGLPAKTAQPARCREAPRAIAAATAMAPSVASFSAAKISRGTSRYWMASSDPAESKSPTQSSGTRPRAAACIMPLSAAMARAPRIWLAQPRRDREITAQQDCEARHGGLPSKCRLQAHPR